MLLIEAIFNLVAGYVDPTMSMACIQYFDDCLSTTLNEGI